MFKITLSTLGLLLAFSANASLLFNYSYEFPDGVVASGSFYGDRNGNVVENVSGITLYINGDHIPGPIYAFQWTSMTYSPQLSFDGVQNDFLFANRNLATGGTLQPGDLIFGTISAYSYAHLLSSRYSSSGYSQANWSLTEAVVPEPGTLASGALLFIPFAATIWRKALIRKG